MKLYIKSTVDITDMPWTDDLTVTEYFDDFIKANIKNPNFLAWGRDVATHEDIVDLWRELRTKNHLKNIYEIPIEDAVDIVNNSIHGGTMEGWFRGADSGYKPSLVEQILARPDVLNAGLNIAYYNYVCDCELHSIRNGTTITPKPFNTWLYEPQIMYRGETGKSICADDVFMSYTPDLDVANKFANYIGGSVHKIKIRPIDTWGSYQTNGEYEFLVPRKYYKLPYKI